jgi:hypothetical protein
MSNQQVTNKPSAAYYLTLIGGILGIIIGCILSLILIGIWIVIANVLCIIFAQRLMNQPNEHSKYGALIIVFAVLGGVNLISLLGGILALTFQPTPVAPTQPYQYQTSTPYTAPPPVQQVQYSVATTKFCPQCGNPVGGEAQYCPKCGTKIPQ